MNLKLQPPDFILNQTTRIRPLFGIYFTRIFVEIFNYVTDIF